MRAADTRSIKYILSYRTEPTLLLTAVVSICYLKQRLFGFNYSRDFLKKCLVTFKKFAPTHVLWSEQDSNLQPRVLPTISSC